jgi:phosphoribosylglycinamide formyltransferase-1
VTHPGNGSTGAPPVTTAGVDSPEEPHGPLRVVVLVSGSGTNLQALLDAARDPGYQVDIVAVGADRPGIEALARAEAADVPTFVRDLDDYADRDEWDAALADTIAEYGPDLVVSAGYMKILGPEVLREQVVINTHPALLPSFPGTHAVRDALAYGVKVTGATVHVVDIGVDTGPVIAQEVVPVEPDDTVESLHARIKVIEHRMLVEVVGRIAHDGLTVDNRKVLTS